MGCGCLCFQSEAAARDRRVRPRAVLETATTAASYGGDDGEFVGGGGGGGFAGGEVADIFVVEVDVDEGAELAFRGEEVLLQRGVRGGERGEGVGNGGAFDGDGGLLVSEGAQRGGDVNLHVVIISEQRFGCRRTDQDAVSAAWGENVKIGVL